MRRVVWAPVLAVLLCLCGTAWAAPTAVNLRVEGATSTIFEGPVTTDGKSIDGHPCDGTTRASPPNPGPGPTMTSALDDASLTAGFGWSGTWSDEYGDFLVDQIAGEQSGAAGFWGTVLNYAPTPVGGCQQQVQQGDGLLFALGNVYGQPLLKLDGDTRAAVGERLLLHVTNGTDGSDVPDATLAGAPGQTGADGRFAVTFDSPGVKTLKAEAAGAIRSNAWQVCVELPGSGTCGGFVSPLVAPRGKVRDSAAPTVRIAGPVNGRRYRHGPRLLRGVASDQGSGVKLVKLALRRHVRGKGCRWWSGRREKFVGRNCRKTFFFGITANASWSYLLPHALGPGHYVLDVKAIDAAGNKAPVFRRGVNRTVFDVVAAKGGPNVSTAAAGARVQVMVVGQKKVIAQPVKLHARATKVRASGRRCAVAASTPLAALAAALGRAKVGYAVRDFGGCTAGSPRSSGQLFVNRIAGERNRGQDGWVYKVDDRAPGRGAADVRLRAGDRVAWIYCKQSPETGGCQRSLRAVPSKRSGRGGDSLNVKVFGYDDKRARRLVPGALVTVHKGTTKIASATTGVDGIALLTFPVPGLYDVSATADGLVPSFPVRIRAR